MINLKLMNDKTREGGTVSLSHWSKHEEIKGEASWGCSSSFSTFFTNYTGIVLLNDKENANTSDDNEGNGNLKAHPKRSSLCEWTGACEYFMKLSFFQYDTLT